MVNHETDTLANLLLGLPGDALLEAKRIYSTWEARLRNKKPGFIFALGIDEHAQLFFGDEYDTGDKLVRIEPDRVSIRNLDGRGVLVGSCNGLVCLRTREDGAGGLDSFEICNPLTGEYLLLPRFISTEEYGISYYQLASGFGYCHSTKEYKVYTIYKQYYDDDEEQEDDHVAHVQVYTIGGKWKYIGCIPFWSLESNLSGVYVNGALHWLQLRINDTSKCEILAFDLKDDTTFSIPFPEGVEKKYYTYGYYQRFHILLGEPNTLYLVRERPFSADIWKRSNQNCNDDIKPWSWYENATIDKPLAISRNNEYLLHVNGQILRYDEKTETKTILWDVPRKNFRHAEAIPYMHSTVCLRDLGETEVRYYEEDSTSRPTIRKRKAIYEGENQSVRSRGAKRNKKC